MKKGNNHKNKAWTEDEDKIVSQLVEKYGTKHWAQISSELHQNYGYKLKSGKQCRQRWHNHLNPVIVKKSWSKFEQKLMFDQHKLYGNKWTVIAEALPGRTDNSIKNHFYSTIRRCLRRMSKLVGSKNSTIKMRNVKPSTLSTVFSLAEGKQNEKQKEDLQMNELSEINFKELATHILDFSQWKPSVKNQQMDHEAMEKFNNMLNSMHKINQIYEDNKVMKAKEKKEKLLFKKFDDICSDSEENEQNSQNLIEEKEEEDALNFSCSRSTRNKRKINPPKSFEPEIKSRKNKSQKNSQEKKMVIEEENVEEIQSEPVGNFLDYEYQGSDNENKMEFDINIEEQEKNFVSGIRLSPGLFPLTPPLTPNQNISLNSTQFQPIKNEECNEIVERLTSRINQNMTGNIEHSSDSIPFHSPVGSAFRFYS